YNRGRKPEIYYRCSSEFLGKLGLSTAFQNYGNVCQKRLKTSSDQCSIPNAHRMGIEHWELSIGQIVCFLIRDRICEKLYLVHHPAHAGFRSSAAAATGIGRRVFG